MEVTQMINTHGMLVYSFLGFLVVGMFVPLLTANNPAGFKKASFIYTMIFQAIATMVAFSGIVALFTGDLGWPLTTIIMLVVWAVLMMTEIKKYKLIKLSKLDNADTFKVLRSAFLKISLVQILLVVVTIVIMMLKTQGAISL